MKNKDMLLYFVLFCVVKGKYLTWSLKNGTNYDFINDAIALWNIKPLEYARVSHNGDINIYFAPFNEHVLGYARNNNIYINQNIVENETIFFVLQHEFGHALGLQHDINSNDTIMTPTFNNKRIINVTEHDKKKLFELYKCRFDSLTLLNYQTYLVFFGSQYKRIDFHTLSTTDDNIWVPFIRNVDSMYRNKSSYIIISNNLFYEFDHTLTYVKQGSIQTIFPKVQFVDAVLTMRNQTILVFENYLVHNNDQKTYHILELFNPFPKLPILGAYEKLDGKIVLSNDQYMYIYNKINFKFNSRQKLCKHSVLSRIHCCQ